MSEKNKLELYIHIPFCARKCLYCDFLSAPADAETQRAYTDQLIEELRAQAQIYGDSQLCSIFIGGGTPSVIDGVQIFNILSAVYENFAVESGAEISIECNPGTLDEKKLDLYRNAGINRVSLGLQSADDLDLKCLGRIHSYDDFLKSYELVREAGFENVNIDLMSAIPGQRPASWKENLRKVAALRPEHISAYSLIIEPGTPFYDRYTTREGKKLLPDEDTERTMYHMTKEVLEEAGYHRYEISNYARPGFECRHNAGYWTGVEYLGVGLGSSSYVSGHRFHSETDLKRYMAVDMHTDLTPLFQDVESLTEEDMMEEFMYLGLRMTDGVSGGDFLARFGQNMFDVFEKPIRKNVAAKLLSAEPPLLRLTERGIDVSNRVFGDFFQYLKRH